MITMLYEDIGFTVLALATKQDPAARAALVKELHLLKTDIFMEMVESGAMPLRPGVKRLVEEAMAAGAGCDTSGSSSNIICWLSGPDLPLTMVAASREAIWPCGHAGVYCSQLSTKHDC